MDRATYYRAIDTVQESWRNKYAVGIVEEAATAFLSYPEQVLPMAFRTLQRNHTILPPIGRFLEAVKSAHSGIASQTKQSREAAERAYKKACVEAECREWQKAPNSPIATKCLSLIIPILGDLVKASKRERLNCLAEELENDIRNSLS